jgi:hypothetical protein
MTYDSSNTDRNHKGNYWTAVIYFKARNGTYKRVPQRAQQGIEKTNGGMVPSFNTHAFILPPSNSPTDGILHDGRTL